MIVDRCKLAEHLRALADRIESGDSLEGSFSYSLPEDPCAPNEVEFSASYRTGNLDGQGGIYAIAPSKARP